jgi:hypothetical protein
MQLVPIESCGDERQGGDAGGSCPAQESIDRVLFTTTPTDWPRPRLQLSADGFFSAGTFRRLASVATINPAAVSTVASALCSVEAMRVKRRRPSFAECVYSVSNG